MYKKIVLGLSVLAILLISGCSSTQRTSRQNFYFNDTNNSIENNKNCFDLCKSRETSCETTYIMTKPVDFWNFLAKLWISMFQSDCTNINQTGIGNYTCCRKTSYHCDYDPVICDKGVCECKTW